MNEKICKVYVEVIAVFHSDGKMVPLSITWRDGRKYHIDRVFELRQAAAMKAGGQGDRYTIRVHGQNKYLYFERNARISGNHIGRWFVEARPAAFLQKRAPRDLPDG